MTALPLSGLKRLLAPGHRAARATCQRCGTGLISEHQHIANLETRSLLCVCADCHELFGAAEPPLSRHRAVPHRYISLPASLISETQWDAFEIPVGIAFFFYNSVQGRVVAAYPSPAGATESLLPSAVWNSALRASPELQLMLPDVEALLVQRTASAHECFIVPIEACYELVGRIRKVWSGFTGGPAVRTEIAAFFRELRQRSCAHV